ncbi:MAG: SDR family oxidoreductase [Bryobacteraceae bacterium]|jgi:NAD(P)-dependent dehydrogenase (short-subunit alcohol dehydrogenase family)/rhamnose utilization protein RhaD (predicted bifunctional aldolase and dehydrogenase)
MDKNSLAQLIEISHVVGANPEYVQAAGGNTSVKSPDGRTMAIKASGTALTLMSETDGWVELDVAAVLSVLDRRDLAALPVNEREARVVEALHSAVVGGRGRPSVETALHAMLGRVVVHTHAVAANALNCGPGLEAVAEICPAGELPPLWVPYTDPGWRLATAVRTAAEAYRKQHRSPPAVIFMENHGLLVAGSDARACLALHDEWVARCERYFSPAAPPVRPAPAIGSAALRKTLAELRRVWRDAFGTRPFARFSGDPELAGAACGEAADLFAAGSLTPDHIVYTGAHAVVAESLDELPAKLKAALTEKSFPRVALVRNVGTFVLAADPAKLDAAEDLAVAGARIVRLAAGRGGAHNLSPSFANFIINWEAEHYRARLLGSAQAALAGHVALVTGAASGLGCGIALGLVEAGAAVAFCDIDDQGAETAATSSADPRRALAVRMDVTSEQSVTAAFDRVVSRWGGVDIVVCAAGIAPPYELVDMPLDKWRLALEINLTGYFLVAREAARIMRAQGDGGSMVMLSSKTGLDASKANSAYNATKAGELHLMRGWALELGRDGIRVNAVAPGNVFEGSKIWNPEYIQAAARKKGIQPEEVIPYYTSLTALNREIKRSDVAAAVVFLCSDAARCITGQTLVVDSGQVMVR